jgi:hypothetical protein
VVDAAGREKAPVKHPFINASGTPKCACCGGENQLTLQPLRLPNPWAYECDSQKCNEDQKEILRRAARHKISYETYSKIHEYQRGRCPICTKLLGKFDKNTVIDHDHSCCSGSTSCGSCVRGILHRQCNSVIGYLGDDPDTFERVAYYLRESPWEGD